MKSIPTPLSRALSKRAAAGGAAFALALIAALPQVSAQQTTAPAGAQTDQPVVLDEYVVAGVRASLIQAQEIKQNSLQFVDSIVAEDIGKFPDNTVAEALQRVPGIQVGRNQGEVSSVVIRGLPNLGTTLNGHEIFTGTGRGVALQDLPTELILGVDVYKTNTPEQIEGGIAGLIDIRLRRPFDFDGFALAGSGRAIYGENAEKTSLVGSLLTSNRKKFEGGGEVGVLFAAAYQKYHFKDQRVFNYLFEEVASSVTPGNPMVQMPFTAGSLLIPGDRKRPAFNLSLQWKPTDNLELYSDFLFTGYRNKWATHFFIGLPRFGEFQTIQLHPGSNVVDTLVSHNNFHLTSTQAFDDRTDGYQWVGGAKWDRGQLRLSTEVVYNWSSVKTRAVIVDTQFAPPASGSPVVFTFDFNQDGGTNVNISGADISNGDNFALWGLFDNRTYQTSDQIAWRADADYGLLNAGAITNVKVGVRITEREARSRASQRNDIPPAAGRGVTRTATIPGFGSAAPDGLFSRSEFGAANWFGGDPDYLRDNADEVRSLFGLPPGAPGFDPASSFEDTETTYAGYVQATYKLDLGGRELDGLFGVRVVQTDQKLVGTRPNNIPLEQTNDQLDVLPMFNARLKLQENLYLRFSAGRSVTRPNFADLNPVASLTPPTTTGGGSGTGTGGNPDLDTVTSDNFDLALEYYISRSDFVSLTGFYRTIDGYVQSFATNEVIDNIPYIVTRPRNSGKGHLSGVEATYQSFPEYLPEALRGLGIQANFTYITGETDAADERPGAPVGARVTQEYSQVAEYNYNIVGIYERNAFSARLAYNWRGEFLETLSGPNAAGSPLRRVVVKPTDVLDFSFSYTLRKGLTVVFQANNILKSGRQDYFANETLYPRDSVKYDRTYSLGVRYSY